MSADRNLLFGLLAVQLDFVSRDAFIDALNAWQFDKAKPLADLLGDGGHLSPGRRKLLDALVEEHLHLHGDDPERSLASLASAESVLRQSLTALGDDDVQRTLKQVLAGADGTPAVARPGPAAGRYRILRPHAKGGLGEVFVAEDTELGRHVALKEIQGRHADDAASRGRFVLEAEITGGLEHPGIVPVYGLGAYPDGRPYYAMRFIQGDNLKDAIGRFHDPASGGSHAPGSASTGSSPFGQTPNRGVDTPRSPEFTSLAFRELLGRFIDVCNAVAYAHSRGVLHRDLKPGNVMLGPFGETLLVDWGLAKVQAGRERERPGDRTAAAFQPRSGDSSATVVGQALGTPAYMSPEQAGGRVADIGPATDVYSLGATLYELLTGAVPFPGRDVYELLDAVKAGRFPPPRAVQQAVPPALDAVCRKAMALKPADRYASALALAQDVERWLADEPVSGYAEPVGLRLRRWVRKHARLVTGAAAACAVGLVAVCVVAGLTEQSRRAVAAERDVAREQKRRTRAALDAMVSEEMVERLKTQAELTAGQREFLQAALGYYKEFAAEAATEESGRKLEADAHGRVGYLLDSLGRRPEAEAAYRAAAAAQAALVADFPGVPDYRRDLARTRVNRGNVLADLGRRAEAEAEYRAALVVQAKLAAAAPALPDDRRDFAGTHTNLGNLLAGLGQRVEAEAEYRAALAVQAKLAADYPAAPDYRSALARAHNNLGVLLKGVGKRSQAEGEYRAALALRETLAADFPAAAVYRRDLAASHVNLGLLLADLGKRPEAEAAYRAALVVQEKLAADFPGVPDYRRDLSGSHNSLGVLLAGLGRRGDAEGEYRAALALREKLAADFPAVPEYRRDLATSHDNLGLLLAAADKRPAAEAAHRAALALRHALAADFPAVPDYRREAAASQTNLGNVLLRAGKRADAESAYRAAVAELEKLAADFPAVPDYRSELAVGHHNLSVLLAAAGKRAESDAAHRAAVAVQETLAADFPAVPLYRENLAVSHTGRGARLSGVGRWAEAAASFKPAVELLARLAADHPDVPAYRRRLEETAVALGVAQVRAGDTAGAVATVDRLVAATPPGDVLYDCACVFAVASAAAGNPDAAAHAARAVELLRQAFAGGYRDLAHTLKDADLAGLRRRDDYAELLWDLADGLPR